MVLDSETNHHMNQTPDRILPVSVFNGRFLFQITACFCFEGVSEINTVFDEESESEVENLEIPHPLFLFCMPLFSAHLK